MILQIQLLLQDGIMVDPFVIYGKRYTDLRDSITTSLKEGEITAFQMLNVRLLNSMTFYHYNVYT